jgi:hypothetical protein
VTLNDWHNMVYYSAARQETDEAGKNCFFCSSNQTLTVLFDSVGTAAEPASAIVMTPGLPRKGRLANASPSDLLKSANYSAANDMRGYFDDLLNFNKYAPGVSVCEGWNTENAGTLPDPWERPSSVPVKCDTYVRPSSRAYDRDRLHLVRTHPGSHCATAARTLVKAAPCKDNSAPNKTDVTCAKMIAALQTCECAAAANEMLAEPCFNTLSAAPHCNAPIAKLNACVK